MVRQVVHRSLSRRTSSTVYRIMGTHALNIRYTTKLMTSYEFLVQLLQLSIMGQNTF